MTKIPEFKTLDEAVEFWESHDSAEYWDTMEDVEFEVDLHRNLVYPKLTILTYRPEQCPRCHSMLEDIIVEYVTWDKEHLVVIRDVPALRCQMGKHEYILERTYDDIEHLLAIETMQKLQPAEIIQVPVFSLKMAV
jgi:YgiT-type zinc finger domain-containing protein